MTLELFFVGGSFVVGVSQMAEAWILLRQQRRLSRAVAATSAVEFMWAVFCVYLLVTGRLEFSRGLAISFVAYTAVATVVGVLADLDWFKHPSDDLGTVRVPKRVIWLGGVFGAAYAAAALFLLAA